MDPRFLKYYNQELQHIREMGAEFAEEFPKIAARLDLGKFECADPYVERLLEGFAFLAARVQLKVDAEFPHFTERLLEAVYPHYLNPLPSMAVVQLNPDLNETSLVEGFPIPRGTVLRSLIVKGEQTACEYRTGHHVTLWPLELTEVQYLPNASAVTHLGAPNLPGLRAGIRLRLKTTAGLHFNELPLKELSFFLRGGGELPVHLYQQVLTNTIAVAIQPVPRTWTEVLYDEPIVRVGFEDHEALLPYSPQSFEGYRILQEYFAFPKRFLFFQLRNIHTGIQRAKSSELDILILLNASNPALINTVDTSCFSLFCTPAVNLFPKRADRIHLAPGNAEHHIVPDRIRPMDYEVHSIAEVLGFGSEHTEGQEFLPFYGSKNSYHRQDEHAYFTIRRQKRLLSSKQKRRGTRSSYIGSEVFIALVDANEAPYCADLEQLGLHIFCTNRDLPLLMPVGVGETDFTLQISAPVHSIRCLEGPTRPRPSIAEGDTSWRLINHLSLNYLSLSNTDAKQGANALRDLLRLYADPNDPVIRKQIDGIIFISSQNVVRRLPVRGPIVFGRGLEIAVELDKSAYEGAGLFLMGAVLEEFFRRYVSINSFTETVIRSSDRGEIQRWPAKIGKRHTL